MKRRRILLLDTGNEWGGGTNSMIELLKRLDRERFHITACFYRNYTKADSTLEKELAAIGVPLLLLPTRKQPLWAKLAKELLRGLLAWHRPWRQQAVFAVERLWRIAPRTRALAAMLREGDYDLLYMNNQPASNLEGYLAAAEAGVPAVQHCRIEPKLNAFERDTVNRVASRVICVSQGVADALTTQGVRAELCSLVHNAIDGRQALPEAVALPELPPGTAVIGSVGQLVKRKSLDQLLRAVASLPLRPTPWVLIVGEGPERAALESLAAQLGIAKRVIFAGFQKQPLPWLAAMDIFALPSAQEGLPRVILEAMLLGKPVVASDIVGSRELVVPGETGFLHAYGDEPALASCLARLLDDDELARRFGNAGRQRVLEEFGIEHYVAEVSRLLEAA
jgi:glycosyltransferase involved in cell wall biosynthesis